MSHTGRIDGISPDDLDLGPTTVIPASELQFGWKKEAEWLGRDLFVGFPCYKQTNPATAWCLLAMALDLGKERIRFDMQVGDAMIYHARNELAMKFLATPAQWLLFLDDDMIPPIGRPDFLRAMCRLPDSYPTAPTALHVAHRLMGHGIDVVGATYFTRHPRGKAVNSLANDQTYRARAASFHDGIMPCDWIGTGCLLIHRRVFEKMQTSFPDLNPTNPDMPFNFFQPENDGRGEDIAFCARAKECGFQPHVDTMLHALHVGHGVYGSHTSALDDIL